jgi:hypothetical protein
LDTSTDVPSVNTIWGGTNVTQISLPGFTFDKTYTIIGPKTIYATTTGILSDGLTHFLSTCMATTTIKLAPGVSGEL